MLCNYTEGLHFSAFHLIINPRHAYAVRVTVLVLCVCVCVCVCVFGGVRKVR